MFTKLREPFGKAGLTVAIFALVLAMVGGAYAAGALSGKQKKEVEKIAKKFAGKPGANGTNGAAGAKGDPGAAGAKGDLGAKGETGAPGAPGKNGTTGFTETLPPNKTETGTWGAGAELTGSVFVPISFPIPLAAGLEEEDVHFVREAETPPEGCEGGTAAEPSAEPGNLCVYVGEGQEHALTVALIKDPGTGEFGAGPAGALLLTVFAEFEEPGEAAGTWAVTAE